MPLPSFAVGLLGPATVQLNVIYYVVASYLGFVVPLVSYNYNAFYNFVWLMCRAKLILANLIWMFYFSCYK